MNLSSEDLERKIEKIRLLEAKNSAKLKRKHQQITGLTAQVVTLQERAYRLTDARCLYHSIRVNRNHGSRWIIEEVNNLTKSKLKIEDKSDSE